MTVFTSFSLTLTLFPENSWNQMPPLTKEAGTAAQEAVRKSILLTNGWLITMKTGSFSQSFSNGRLLYPRSTEFTLTVNQVTASPL